VQKRVEGYHFDIRKHLVEYDDVVNKHREVIYSERRKILSGADLKANILSMIEDEIRATVDAHIPDEHGIDMDITGLVNDITTIFPLPPSFNDSTLSDVKPQQIGDKIIDMAEALYEQREQKIGAENMRILERLVMLRIIDSLWVEHLTMMEYMRQGIGLQAMAQRDPLVAYKREGHRLFQNLMSSIQHDVVRTVYHVTIQKREAPQPEPTPMDQAAGRDSGKKQKLRAGSRKIGRNDPCPCGSGKKYKYCCGR
jgi:preprotein translocase subunit SecA